MSCKSVRNITRRDFIKTVFTGACVGSFCGRQLSVKASSTNAEGFEPARWIDRISNNKIQCNLCPFRCRLNKGETARCRVRKNIEGSGYTLSYANPAIVEENPVERSPFFHVLPGSRVLSVSTTGCNLECKFCEVWDIALAAPDEVHTYEMSVDTILRHAKSAGLESVNFSFGEPVVFYEYMYDIAVKSKSAGFKNLIHSALFIEPEPLKTLCKYIDAVNVDLKAFCDDFYQEICNGRLKPVLDALKILKENGVWIEITNIIIPSMNDDISQIKQMCEWIKDNIGDSTPLHFARFYPLYRLSNLPPTPVSTLDEVRNTALEVGLKHVYLSRVTGHEAENSYCSNCKKKLISRMGFIVDENLLVKASCPNCGTKFPGVF